MAQQKLLLIEDVLDLGRSGDIVNVRHGFARNYLLPQGYAVVATGQALKMQAKLQDERIKKAAEDKRDSEALAEKLTGLTLSKTVKVDHDGHMYGSVTIADIVHLLEQTHGIVIEKKFVQLKHPIKEVGVHDIQLKLNEGVTSQITLKVVAEEHHQ